MADLAKRLAALRARKGLSQLDLAQRLGVSKQAISQFETGRAIPNLETAAKLAALLGTNLNALGGLTDADTLSLTEEDCEFLSAFHTLPHNIQEFLRVTVRANAMLMRQKRMEEMTDET